MPILARALGTLYVMPSIAARAGFLTGAESAWAGSARVPKHASPNSFAMEDADTGRHGDLSIVHREIIALHSRSRLWCVPLRSGEAACKAFRRCAMASRGVLRFVPGLLLGLAGLAGYGQTTPHALSPQPASARRALAVHAPSGPVASYLKMPLRFEANRGQTDKRVRFISRGLGYTLFLTSRKAVLVLATPTARQGAPGKRSKSEATASPGTRPSVVSLELTGANSHPAITEEDPLPAKSNYFIGNDPNKWRTKIPDYAEVRYRDVYPGIDLIYYGNQRRLEHDFVVAPGADPGRITLGLRGVSKLRIDGGDLVMSTPQGESAPAQAGDLPVVGRIAPQCSRRVCAQRRQPRRF